MGPLAGIRILEFAGVGPVPMAGMLLADMGATVLRIERREPSGLGIPRPHRFSLLDRGRMSAAIDLKKPQGLDVALRLVDQADALFEGFRPGTMERIGLGPELCHRRNPRLVYGRVTGWGQTGPLASAAGHDINYIALTGALHAIGRAGAPPTPPLNLLGDYGGALYLALGILGALLERSRSGRGQVVDAAMVDAAGSLLTSMFGLRQAQLHNGPRGTNLIASGAPFYDVYRCADGEYISIAPIEEKFWRQFVSRLALSEPLPDRDDRKQWPALRARLTEIFAQRTRAAWCDILEGTDACFAPVLAMEEAIAHPHNVARESFLTIDRIPQPAPAPRFDRTPCAPPTPPETPGESTVAALRAWNFQNEEIRRLSEQGIVGPAPGA